MRALSPGLESKDRKLIRHIATGLLVLICGTGIAAAQQAVTRPGTHELTLPGSERRYTLVIPRGYSGDEPVPLIMSLHFGGPVTPYIGRSLLEQLIEPALDELGAIIVAPDSAANGWANPTAERHVVELLEYIEANYNVDKARTLLTGYSMGGMGTWYLAPRRPDLFEAAIPMAGRPEAGSTGIDWQTPTYVINSRADELIPFERARSAVESLQARGAPIELVAIDGVTHFQIPRYRRYLRAAIPWIEDVWSR
jgi:predicted peptidase